MLSLKWSTEGAFAIPFKGIEPKKILEEMMCCLRIDTAKGFRERPPNRILVPLNSFSILFYDSSTNSRALIGLFLSSISGQAHEFVIYPTRQRARAYNLTVCYCIKTKLTSVSHASVLLLTMNFVITLSK